MAEDNRVITIIMAPLQGYTDAVFRNVFAGHFSGVDEAVAPFISTMGQKRLKPSRIRDVAPENNHVLPVVPQILGNVPEDFIFLAARLYEMGHSRINWNLGCPHAKIAKKRKGSGLLSFPEQIDAFLEKVMPALPGTLSVKIRLGRKSKDEMYAVLEVLDKYPLEEVILHPRTGIQMYEGPADQDAFSDALLNSRHQFVYNGDIVDLPSFERIRDRFKNVRRFMIGRGLLADPFLAESIKGIHPGNNPAERLKSFHNDLFESYQKVFSGPAHLTGRMKGFWHYLGPSRFPGSSKVLKKLLKTRSIDRYREMADAMFLEKYSS